MLRTLRRRMVVSHLVPMLLTVPLLGIVLIALIEAQVGLPHRAQNLQATASALAGASLADPSVWSDPQAAQAFVTTAAERTTAQMMLISGDGQVLASSTTVASPLGPTLQDVSRALDGEPVVQVEYDQTATLEVIDVLQPVVAPSGTVVGVIRVTQQLPSVTERLQRLRYLIIGVLIGGLVLGAALGSGLALNLERPLEQTTAAISQFAIGQQYEALPQRGPAEIRSLVQSFNTLVERLERLEQGRQVLLANLVHELGRPLGALQSATEALQGGAADDPELGHELLAGMAGELRRLRRLVDDLAQLHDHTVGPPNLATVPTDLHTWLPPLLTPWREMAAHQGIEWSTMLPDQPLLLLIDPDRVAQALGNIMSNAIKYTPRSGCITITVTSTAQTVAITVADTGIGMSAAERTHIFEPFYRGPATRRFPQGMGLGLSIAHDLVLAHGGRIEVAANQPQGSCLTVVLPRNG